MRLGLVGDVRTKRPQAVPARDLYQSRLFTARRRHVERTCDLWFILSAAHGLLHPDQIVGPYVRTLKGESREAKAQWAARVLWQLDHAWEDWRGTTVEIHAGENYRCFGLIEGFHDRGAAVSVPAEHLSGGAQLAFYASTDVIDLTTPAIDLTTRH